ncbi:MAG TPA: glycerol-3-phosphate dehydrogenase C-terminal domain-containing protein, partial [Phnomibacter sp.]|nr:glycerol-3-phosphate dehydrogenase C-terminal domain-containing protein [Phnomibacter sp.]
WTTYRLMARDTIDETEKWLGVRKPCTTDAILLIGSRSYDHTTAIDLQQRTGWDHEVVKHLVSKYGDRCQRIGEMAAQDAALKERLLPGMPYTVAELHYVLQEEMVYTLKDVLARRWGTQLADWQQTRQLIPLVAAHMSNYLGWTTEDMNRYKEEYLLELDLLESEMKGMQGNMQPDP